MPISFVMPKLCNLIGMPMHYVGDKMAEVVTLQQALPVCCELLQDRLVTYSFRCCWEGFVVFLSVKGRINF